MRFGGSLRWLDSLRSFKSATLQLICIQALAKSHPPHLAIDIQQDECLSWTGGALT